MSNTYVYFILCCLFLFSYNLSKAQYFSATPEAYEIPLNYPFKIEYEIGYKNVQNFIGPQFADFNASAPAKQYVSVITNGHPSESISIIYVLKAKRQGVFTIPPATIVVNGKAIQSNSVTVKITAPQKYEDPAEAVFQQMQKQMEDMERQMQEQMKEQQQINEDELQKEIANSLFVRVIPSKTSCYQGDQITLSYKIYSTFLPAIQINKIPNYEGCLSEDYKLPEPKQNTRPPIETYNGKRYFVQEIKRVSLFPIKSGKIIIEPVELISDLFVQYQPYEYKFKSNAIELDVKPLPEKNKPATFSGAVGKFSFSAEYDKTKCRVGEPISLKVTYKGSGNLKLISAPKLQFPEEFEAYEPKVKDDYQNNGTEVAGSKTFEYVIVPQDGGKFKLPKYEFAYFDVAKQDYVKYTLPETEIDVEGKAKISENVINFFKRTKEDKPKDIYGIKKQYTSSADFTGSTGFWALTITPLLFLLIGFIFRKRDYSESDLLMMRRNKANKLALRRMATAKKLMQQNNEQGFYNEVIRALWEYLSDKLYIPQSELSKENIADKLRIKNVADEKIESLKTTLDTCEQSLFSPAGKENAMQTTYSKAVELIIDFEEQLKNNVE